MQSFINEYGGIIAAVVIVVAVILVAKNLASRGSDAIDGAFTVFTQKGTKALGALEDTGNNNGGGGGGEGAGGEEGEGE